MKQNPDPAAMVPQNLPHVLYIVGQLSIGGIETYVVRMAQAYSKAGGKVSVWVIKYIWDSELLEMLQEVADITFISSKMLPYPVWVHSPPIPESVDLVFTTGRLSVLFGAHACSRAKRPIRLIAGVFSQWEYCSNDRNGKTTLAAHILEQIGPRNTVFCTEGCRQDHKRRLGKKYSGSIISPLLIYLPTVKKRQILFQDVISIVTVSRLTSFKTSNHQLPGIIRQLLERGIEAKWTHYGDGPEKPNIESEIKHAGVENMVKLAGPIAYSELYKVLGSADLYVGGGTTLIEAASMGTPAIVALDENEEATTPGFFADRDSGYTSDRIEGERLYKLVDVITEFSRFNSDELSDLMQRSIMKASFYNIDRCSEEIAAIMDHSSTREVFLPHLFQTKYIIGSIFELINRTLKFGYERNA